MASRGLRTLALSYVDFPEHDASRADDFFDTPSDENLTAMCIVGIKVGIPSPSAPPTPCCLAGPCALSLSNDRVIVVNMSDCHARASRS